MANDLSYLCLKVVTTIAAIKASGFHAAVLETAVLSCMGKGHFDQFFVAMNDAKAVLDVGFGGESFRRLLMRSKARLVVKFLVFTHDALPIVLISITGRTSGSPLHGANDKMTQVIFLPRTCCRGCKDSCDSGGG
jgi:hypothetical protein